MAGIFTFLIGQIHKQLAVFQMLREVIFLRDIFVDLKAVFIPIDHVSLGDQRIIRPNDGGTVGHFVFVLPDFFAVFPVKVQFPVFCSAAVFGGPIELRLFSFTVSGKRNALCFDDRARQLCFAPQAPTLKEYGVTKGKLNLVQPLHRGKRCLGRKTVVTVIAHVGHIIGSTGIGLALYVRIAFYDGGLPVQDFLLAASAASVCACSVSITAANSFSAVSSATDSTDS